MICKHLKNEVKKYKFAIFMFNISILKCVAGVEDVGVGSSCSEFLIFVRFCQLSSLLDNLKKIRGQNDPPYKTNIILKTQQNTRI
jgi:hypothetical protein